MKIILVNQTTSTVSLRKAQKYWDQIIKAASTLRLRNKAFLKLPEITFVFLKSTEMKRINFQYRKKNRPTDVLSFSPVEKYSIGELIFCIEVLRKQAREQKHSLEKELSYMMIHGLLHLLGYDHELSDREQKLMFSIQDKIFEQLTAQNIKIEYFNN